MIARRGALIGLCALVASLPFSTRAGSRAVVGVLLPGGRPASGSSIAVEGLKAGFRAAGMSEGRDLDLHVRWTGGDRRAAENGLAELVENKASLLITASFPLSQMARHFTQRTPMVTVSSDPVGTGLVGSLARPGGNVTGISYMTPDLNGKRLEILNEIVPGLTRLAVIWDPRNGHEQQGFRATAAAADAKGIELVPYAVGESDQSTLAAVEAVGGSGVQAFIAYENPILVSNRAAYLKLAARLPAIFELTDFVRMGALSAYGPSYFEIFSRAAAQAAKILRSANPEGLPVEQPTRFELVLNLKTADALGIAVSPSLLARADEVIE